MSDHFTRPGGDLWDGRWDDHRWGDPTSRATVDQPQESPPWPTEPVEPGPARWAR